ncbi:gliding motility lipoprotein GldD [Arundinibacter roseus]|uniref:Gliding motility lipoprotein GldD n=1 Tax=Arundinibacter roseus TaxID=2070510 RepID=A0A4R4K8I7_9BACT|nr:gliding motility lipoprotein GldD [Arundinibacter roseus]TDB64004.1 gliding motility lipoprotein GldD [Arundinibacter roseus]
MNRSICSVLFALCIASTLAVLTIGCGSKEEPAYFPKPKGFNRINLPAQTYQSLPAEYPYSFEFSTAAVILPDTFAMAEKYWIFLYYPRFNANIQLTYKPVMNSTQRLGGYIEDAYKLAVKHQIRASALQEQRLTTKTGKTVTLFKIEGEVPSPFQFYVTDSTTHYLRGAIYFPTATKNDSLAPIIEFMQRDALHLLNTLQWRN